MRRRAPPRWPLRARLLSAALNPAAWPRPQRTGPMGFDELPVTNKYSISYSIFPTRRGPLKRRTFCEAATQLLQIRPRGPAPTSHPQHWNEQIGRWEDAAGQPRPDATRNQRRVEQRRGTQREPRNRSAASKLANAIYAERCRAVRSAARRHECSANLASAPGPTSKSIALAHRYEWTAALRVLTMVMVPVSTDPSRVAR